jgi:sugar lactone lactonase YvrE
MSRKHSLCLVVLLALLSTATQSGLAQNPLNFGNNFFVTGDYVVAGAQGMNSHTVGGIATGTFSIPDTNPGIRSTNRNTVPKGANIIAALLYWQTVEKVGATGSGQKGFFGPVFNTMPPVTQLYPIFGEQLPSHGTVAFSSGGCSGGSTGKTVQTYRADVRAFLPLDADGNVLVDAADGVTFEVKLPSTGGATPLTLGASLVFIYRVISPNFPLNVITIYDGAFDPSSTPTLTMSQTIQGFYQVANSPKSRLTHIVGSGLSNKLQTAYLTGGQGVSHQRLPATKLPSPYGSGQPAFPGFYGTWDNTTWMFPDAMLLLDNPLQENDDTATASVVAATSGGGCPSWAATILSTTVHDDNNDGILQVWKNNRGYTDVATGQFVSLDDALDEPTTSQKDIFIQMDHVVDSNGDFSTGVVPSAITLVHDAFRAKNIHLHITHGNPSVPGSEVINEQVCNDQPAASPPYFCPYVAPQVGVTAWRFGFEFIKNQGFVQNAGIWQPVDEPTCESANNTTPGSCQRRFPIAQRNSHHYVVIGDTLGAANWTFLAGILTGVSQAVNTVTFQTAHGHGLKQDDGTHMANMRVTVSEAITNPNLNGTFFVTNVNCPTNPVTLVANDCAVTNQASGPYTFQITIGGSSVTQPYTLRTDPYLQVFSGQATSGSGLSDVGGVGTLVTLGQWGTNATLSAYAGTLMHELGHTLGLNLHGGSFYDHVSGDYRPTIEPNCKSNYQSVMNYMFQTRLLGPDGVLDFSSQALSPLNETSLGPISTTDSSAIAFPTTDWYDTTQTLVFKAATPPSPANTANITSFAIGSGVVMFQAANSFTAGTLVEITGLSIGTYLNGQVLTVSGTGLSGTQFQASFTHVDVLSTADTGTAVSGTLVPLGQTATHHCDDTPLNINDPATYFYSGGTLSMSSSEIMIPWSGTKLDANFDGTVPSAVGSENPVFRGYNDWANVDLRQVGATGSSLLGPAALLNGGPGGTFAGPGAIFNAPGGTFGGPGGTFGGPGGTFGGPGGTFGGPGGTFGGPGGTFGGPGGTFGGPGEINLGIALSVTPPPTHLAASEAASPRPIKLTWTEPNFPQTEKNNIYRSSDGVHFSFLASVPGTPPGTQNTFTDMPACNPTGYTYYVTTVVLNTTLSPPQEQESTQATVSTGQNNEPLTACYGPTATGFNFSSPANAVQGSIASITWILQDASNKNGSAVNNPAANTLVVTGPGPLPSCASGGPTTTTTILMNGHTTAQSGVLSTFPPPNLGNYTFNWDTDGFCAGRYTVQLILDSTQTATSQSQLSIDVTNLENTPHINPVSLPDATIGVAYTFTIPEDGGIGPPFTWTVVPNSSTLPPGITLDPSTGTLSGTPTQPGTYTFTAQVTDSATNVGTQALTLRAFLPLFVVDQNNNRVLWDHFPSSAALGQTSFTASAAPAPPTAASMSHPYGAAVDSHGNLFVSDLGNCRVLQFQPSFTTGMSATLAVGQASGATNLTTGTCLNGASATATGLGEPRGLALDGSGNLWVADASNSRVLSYLATITAGETATVALGQTSTGASLTCNEGGAQPNAGTLCAPSGLAFDSFGNLWVADTQNNRVLMYPPASLVTGGAATVELGQPSGATAFTSNAFNNGGISPTSLDGPTGLAFDSGGNLWVADSLNNRVLMYPPASLVAPGGGAATVELGQPLGATAFTSNTVNNGGIGASTLSNPVGVVRF